MTDRGEPISEQQLESFLDGLMNPSERAAFEAQLEKRPDLRAAVELQSRIDAALRRQYEPPVLAEETVAQWGRADRSGQASPIKTPPRKSKRDRRTWLAVAVTAAAIAIVFVAWLFGDRREKEPFFEPRPLADIYRETVANGFKPYYECRDEDRFAFTFATRQGQPLQLAQLPEGRRMLGLSYSGGLSRNTTAMLCRVDEQPVIVFVDRQEADQALASQHSGPDLHVLRKEYHGLVMYEVTPFTDARMMDHLILPTSFRE